MFKGNRLFVFLIFISFGINSCKNESNEDRARGVVIKAFKFSFEQQYDSLSEILNSSVFENSPKDASLRNNSLNVYFYDMINIVRLSGLPKYTDLKGYYGSLNGGEAYILTYYPRSKLEEVDSIKFIFRLSPVFDRISLYQVFIPIPKLKGITPLGAIKGVPTQLLPAPLRAPTYRNVSTAGS